MSYTSEETGSRTATLRLQLGDALIRRDAFEISDEFRRRLVSFVSILMKHLENDVFEQRWE